MPKNVEDHRKQYRKANSSKFSQEVTSCKRRKSSESKNKSTLSGKTKHFPMKPTHLSRRTPKNSNQGNFKESDEDLSFSSAIDQYLSSRAFKNEADKNIINSSRFDCDSIEPFEITHRQVRKSGIFSFLAWFKKKKEFEDYQATSVASSPAFFRRSTSDYGSVDTLFSTTTVSSFAFVSPNQYKPVLTPEINKREINKANTDEEQTKRLKESLEKTELKFAFPRRRKRKAPEAPALTGNLSLPTTLDHMKKKESDKSERHSHRRNLSEPFDNSKSVNCHVRGKRKAPLPPPKLSPSPKATRKKTGSYGSRKKKAPLPPMEIKNDFGAYDESNMKKTETKSNEPATKVEKDNSNYVCNPPEERVLPLPATVFAQPTSGPSRFWYKRSNKNSNKSSKKKRDKENHDKTPEVGFARPKLYLENSPNRFNFFSRLERSEKEEKRKSQISMLANISDLDKEAAEILRKEYAQEREIMAANNDRFYTATVLEKQPEECLSVNQREFFSASSDKNVPPSVRKSSQIERKHFSCDYTTDLLNGKCPLFEEEEEEEEMRSWLKIKPEKAGISPKKKPGKTPRSSALLEEITQETLGILSTEASAEKSGSDIDWGEEIKKYFPKKREVEKQKEATEQLQLKENKDPNLKSTQTNSDKKCGIENVKDFQTKSGGSILDENEKLQLKEILRDMKNSLIRRNKEVLPNITVEENSKPTPKQSYNNGTEKSTKPIEGGSNQSDISVKDSMSNGEKSTKSIKPEKTREAPKKKEDPLSKSIQYFSTVFLKDPISYKTDEGVKIGSDPFKLTRLRDLNRMAESKIGNSFPPPQYANFHNLGAGYEDKPSLSIPQNSAPTDRKKSPSPSTENENKEVKLLIAKLMRFDGLDDFKNELESSLAAANMNTQSVDVLLARLEEAVQTRQYLKAADLAKELAKMKIHSSIVKRKLVEEKIPASITIDMYIEDKTTHQGPIPLPVAPNMSVNQLKLQVETEFHIPVKIQRWILGKQLASDDNKSLQQYNIITDGCPVFLYVVNTGQEDKTSYIRKETTIVDNSAQILVNKEKSHDQNILHITEDEPKPAKEVENKPEEFLPTKGILDRLTPQPDVANAALTSKNQAISGSAQQPIPKLMPPPNKSTRKDVRRNSGRSILDLVKPEMNEALKKDLKVLSVSSVKETIEKLNKTINSNKANSDAIPLEWKCPLCTLTNLSSRPACAACTAERPANILSALQFVGKGQNARTRGNQLGDNSDAPERRKDHNNLLGENREHYLQLVHLDKADVVPNTVNFECPICFLAQSPGEGVVLRECLHTFCRPCLISTIQLNEEAEVKCPYRDNNYSCDSVLLQREIRALVPNGVFEQHLAKSVSQAEGKMGNTFHCKTPDCRGWCFYEDNVNEFNCPVCKTMNCLTCQAIHDNLDCKQYQEQVRQALESNVDVKRTREMLEEMVGRGEAMICPSCEVMLMKKWGCDWLRCSMCKTEICWVTRGPRWGPGGKGDTSGGCQCGVNGIKCHPKCNYCH